MKKCIVCNKKLIGRQTKFCSIFCKNRHYQNYSSQYVRGLARKKLLVMQCGGACARCGYHKNLASLVFHHNTPSKKLIKLDMRHLANNKWEMIKREVDKCTLLCANCHGEYHYPNLEY